MSHDDVCSAARLHMLNLGKYQGYSDPSWHHALPVVCIEQTRFLVLIADWTEVSADNLKIGVLSNVVLGHLEHAEMEIRDRAERSTCDENYRLLGWIT